MANAIALLPIGVQSSLPWPRDELRTIELPKGAAVPDGALQKGRSDRGLLMRSMCETPLVDQAATLATICGTISTELGTPKDASADAPYLHACFDLGWLLEENRRWVRLGFATPLKPMRTMMMLSTTHETSQLFWDPRWVS